MAVPRPALQRPDNFKICVFQVGWRSPLAIALLAALLATPFLPQTAAQDTTAAAASNEPVKTGEALVDAVEANSEAQDYKEEAKPVKAQVVQQEPAALIASGTGDIDTTGHSCTLSLP